MIFPQIKSKSYFRGQSVEYKQSLSQRPGASRMESRRIQFQNFHINFGKNASNSKSENQNFIQCMGRRLIVPKMFISEAMRKIHFDRLSVLDAIEGHLFIYVTPIISVLDNTHKSIPHRCLLKYHVNI